MTISVDVFKKSGKWNYSSVYYDENIDIYNTDAILDYLYEQNNHLIKSDFVFKAKNPLTREINSRLVTNSKK